MESILLKYNYYKGLFLKYQLTIDSNTKALNSNIINIKSVCKFSIEVKDMDEFENKTLEIICISAEMYSDGKKVPCHEYDNIPVITMKLNEKNEPIDTSHQTDLSFSLYPEEPKKINDEWTMVSKPFPKSKNRNQAIEDVKNYTFSDLIKYKGIDVAVLKFTCPEMFEKFGENLYIKISSIGKELFDYKNGILVKTESNTIEKRLYGDSLKEILERNYSLILELINDS